MAWINKRGLLAGGLDRATVLCSRTAAPNRRRRRFNSAILIQPEPEVADWRHLTASRVAGRAERKSTDRQTERQAEEGVKRRKEMEHGWPSRVVASPRVGRWSDSFSRAIGSPFIGPKYTTTRTHLFTREYRVNRTWYTRFDRAFIALVANRVRSKSF